jgi:putative ubiquitin-RnfH superfamily antitoxin RatB of RatAB toxin-antitoxin module
MSAEALSVTVVLAHPDRAEIRQLELAEGATVADALAASGLTHASGEPDGASGSRVGIFGRRVELERRLASGDQIEIYLPLASDPKSRRLAVARRQRERRTQRVGVAGGGSAT